MSFDRVKEIVSMGGEVCLKAYEKLVSEGVSSEVAMQRVELNFIRINGNSNQILTVEELCK